MTDDIKYLANYLPDKLYTHPAKAGTYATIVGESELLIGEVDVTTRCKSRSEKSLIPMSLL